MFYMCCVYIYIHVIYVFLHRLHIYMYVISVYYVYIYICMFSSHVTHMYVCYMYIFCFMFITCLIYGTYLNMIYIYMLYINICCVYLYMYICVCIYLCICIFICWYINIYIHNHIYAPGYQQCYVESSTIHHSITSLYIVMPGEKLMMASLSCEDQNNSYLIERGIPRLSSTFLPLWPMEAKGKIPAGASSGATLGVRWCQ